MHYKGNKKFFIVMLSEAKHLMTLVKNINLMRSFASLRMTMKPAFTFAELMISLVVIAVITVVLFPAISDMAPNNNKYLFKSAYKTIESTVAEIAGMGALPNSTNASTYEATCLCNEFKDKLNVVENSCNTANGEHVCPNGNTYTGANEMNNTFITSNGMRWAFGYSSNDSDNSNSPTLQILVDVNQNNNNKLQVDNKSPVNVKIGDAGGQLEGFNNSLSDVWKYNSSTKSASGIFYTNNNITQDTFMIKIDANSGRIVFMSPVAYQHLADEDD